DGPPDHRGVEGAYLYVVPVLLVERAIPHQALIKPAALPADLVVGQRVRRQRQRRAPAAVQRSLLLISGRGASGKQRIAQGGKGGVPESTVEDSGAEPLRPRVVKQCLLAEFPAEVGAAPEAGIAAMQVQRVEVDEL